MQRKLITYFIDCIVISVFIIAFHLFFWNKYLPIQEGWFNVFADMIQSGLMPYRDFYLFLQPLYPLWITAIVKFFGNTIVVLRLYGVLERIALTIVLYLIYRKISERPVALFASIVSLICCSGFNADVIYSYYQTTILFLLLACYFLLQWINCQKWKYFYLFLVGFFSSLAFLTKQSTGLIVPVFFSCIILLASVKEKKNVINNFLFFSLSGLIPISIVLMWLYANGAIIPYLNQVFINASSSKGGIGIVFNIFKHSSMQLLYGLPAAFFLVFLFYRNWRHIILNHDRNNKLNIIVFISLIFSFILYFFTRNMLSSHLVANFFIFKEYFLVFFIFDFSVLLTLLLFVVNFFDVKYNPKVLTWLTIALTSFVIAYSHTLSAFLEEHAVMLGLGLFVVLLFKLFFPYRRAFLFFPLLLGMVVIIFSIKEHINRPYAWWGWSEPRLKYAKHNSNLALLKGMKLSYSTKLMYEEIAQIIHTYLGPNDTLYQFPHMPIFYLFANKLPHYYSITNYFDVCSDQCAKKDADMIMYLKPKIIIVNRFPEQAWVMHETIFRRGRRSGQREIIENIDYLIKHEGYIKYATYHSGEVNYPLELWLRSS